MNKVIRLSENTVIENANAELDKALENHKDIPNFQILHDQAVSIISEFILKAKSVASTRTTIHIKKELFFDDLKISLILDSPEKLSFADKLKKILGF